MITLDKKTADILAKMFVSVHQGQCNKNMIRQLDETLYRVQRNWTNNY